MTKAVLAMTRPHEAGGRLRVSHAACNPLRRAMAPAQGYDTAAVPPPELAANLRPAGEHAVEVDVPEGMAAARLRAAFDGRARA